jgi:hypothetical protein
MKNDLREIIAKKGENLSGADQRVLEREANASWAKFGDLEEVSFLEEFGNYGGVCSEKWGAKLGALKAYGYVELNGVGKFSEMNFLRMDSDHEKNVIAAIGGAYNNVVRACRNNGTSNFHKPLFS